MLTQQQIDQFRRKAKQAGYSEAQIANEIARKQKEVARQTISKTSTRSAQTRPELPQMSVNQNMSVEQPSEQKKGFLGSVAQGAMNLGKTLVSPFRKAAGFGTDLVLRNERIGGGQEARRRNPFLNEAEVSRLNTVGGAAKEQAKNIAGIGSFVVPAGKSVKAAAGLGAVSAGMFESSQEGATPRSVAKASVVGGAFAGGAKAVTKGTSWLFKNISKKRQENLLQKVGRELREDATRIRVKPGVYGAKKEKQIQETLNSMGISGSPQEKYEQLEPVMGRLTEQIDTVIDENPRTVNVSDVAKKFRKLLDNEVRTRSITSTTAKKEVNGYLTDLLKTVDPELQTGNNLLAKNTKLNPNIDLKKAFRLKQLVNQDYSSIQKKIINNTPLNDREKVVFYARQALDDAITDALPEIKDLTVMQSHLYDAAQSLSSARNTVPTFRFAGTTIPKGRTAQDSSGRLISQLGNKVESIVNEWVDPVTGTLKEGVEKLNLEDKSKLFDALLKLGVLTSSTTIVGEEDRQKPQQKHNSNANDGNGSRQENNNQQDNEYIDQNIPSLDKDIVPQHPIFGNLSKQEVSTLAFQSGANMEQLDEIEAIYDRFSPESGAVISEETRGIVNDLRAEYISQTKQNKYMDAVTHYRKINTTPDTAAGDLSMIFAYMKMLDPGSVVRESEQDLAANATSLPGQLQNYALRVAKGKKLNDKQRAEFRDAAAILFDQYQIQQNQIDDLYSNFATRYGVDPELLGIGAIGIE